ncbi:YceI family protein [Flavobacterium cellulosilyticum]|uniref:Polyisoprenoid-binding protein n=1 Tax=Flavobacterium cellulosilyticum TaxID=2541731 RepID=A0A4V2Z030_9FLAO|nr:YceI family protein [Flavobacterium cellulosilyticum]TDD99417.1 polyisoprenoid-binding protein [Flavobacterium cellulosilyticum]
MITKWNINEEQSDVLIKLKDATITYLGGTTNHFKGFVNLDEDEIEDASVEFTIDNNSATSQNRGKSSHQKNEIGTNKKPLIRFKSTSFQKIKNNINFFKGSLTIKDITRIVELDAEFIGINNYNGTKKAAFEIKGNINRQDFGIDANFYNSNESYHFGKELKLIANLEFSI